MATATTPAGDASVASGGIPAAHSHIEFDEITQSLPPSHILPDGRYIYLPPPTRKERNFFFERSIARHGLLQEDIENKKQKEQEKKEEEKKEKLKVHPLALASARLQADGINELNRAINLSTLVASGEYFGLSNIVDPSLEIPAATSSNAAADNKNESKASSGPSGSTPASSAAATAPESAMDLQDEQRLKASFVLKRKRFQFEKASNVLSRHSRRLQAAILAQARPDQRLLDLRAQQSWRLVAPEHGTRALPHAARPTEVVACDVDLYHVQQYHHDTQHQNSNGGLQQQQQKQQQQSFQTPQHAVLGRIAKRVPRYATMELREDYVLDNDLKTWRNRFFKDKHTEAEPKNKQEDLDDERAAKKVLSETEKSRDEVWTRAEPFAIADPTLGKLDADFDPKKVAMLSLRFIIEKASTGFQQSAILEPITITATSTMMTSSSAKPTSVTPQDEVVLSALQHSLFCAKLFESIRRELAPDTEDVGQTRITSAKMQLVVWLSGCESEANFLPPPSQLSGDQHRSNGLALLSVIHCHEGEVKVQLDCEYTLTVKLVEAGQQHRQGSESLSASLTSHHLGAGIISRDDSSRTSGSGSQSPEQLTLLCRALLLHAQERYHEFSIRAAEKLQKQGEEGRSNPIAHMRQKDSLPSPCILQSCVSLGTKMLFEHRIRQRLRKVNDWVKSLCSNNNNSSETRGNQNNVLHVEWLSLSVFDLHGHFTVSFRSTVMDVYIFCEEMTVTSMNDDGDYRKATFHSDDEFEVFLKLKIRRILRESLLR